LQTIAEDIANTEQQKDEADRELTSLENSLATPLEDFTLPFMKSFTISTKSYLSYRGNF
jgi:hypothetical protein